MKKHIPNLLTSINILCGGLAIIFAFQGSDYLWFSSVLIAIGAFFDFFDGMSARLLKVTTSIGKELDSLADMVTFGMAPAAIMYQLLVLSITGENKLFTDLTMYQFFTASISMLIVVFSGIRLAKFNVDTRQTDAFIGLATPANALVIISFPLIIKFHPDSFFISIISNTYILIVLTIFLSLMMVSEYKMFSLKFKNINYKSNQIRFIFIGLVIITAFFLQFAALPVIILIYIILSVIDNYILHRKTNLPESHAGL